MQKKKEENTVRSDPSYLSVRPKDLRRPKWGNRFSFIQRELPSKISELINSVGISAEATVLDFGCADKPYSYLLPPSCKYIGADLTGNPNADINIKADGSIELQDESVDFLLSTQVLEHVADPGKYLSECHRVLKPNGVLLLTTHGIMIWHNDPVDYWRWTGEGLGFFVENAGFKIESFAGIMGLAPVGVQLFQDATFSKLPRGIRRLYTLLCQTFIRAIDRFHSEESKRRNALVFAITARKSERMMGN